MSDDNATNDCGTDEPVLTRLQHLMPATVADKAILDARAEQLARLDNEDELQHESHPYIRFRLGDKEEYGISYDYAEEILSVNAVSKVPCTPPHVQGVINRRGEMLTVLNLHSSFRAQRSDNMSDHAAVIVVRAAGLLVGILVDEVIGSDEYEVASLADPLPSNGVSNLEFVQGIYNGRVTMLDLDALLADSGLAVNESVS